MDFTKNEVVLSVMSYLWTSGNLIGIDSFRNDLVICEREYFGKIPYKESL